jgi:DNA-binding transcriptional LysR family regulator
MQISADRLLILRTVAAAGGVGAAARQLHLAPSGISQHLARLERETGLVLVDRFSSGGQRPLRLTAAGRRLAAHGERLADVLAEAEDDVNAMSQRLSGTLDVGAFSSVMTRLVVPAIRLLKERAPGVQVRVTAESSEPAALAALRGGDLHLLLVEDDQRGRRTERPGVQHRWLLNDPYRVVVPATWPLPRQLADLDGRPWIGGPPATAVELVLQRVRRASGLALPTLHACAEFPAVLALVEAGLGAAIIPELALPLGTHPGIQSVALPEFGVRHLGAVVAKSRRPPALVVEALAAFSEAAADSA